MNLKSQPAEKNKLYQPWLCHFCFVQRLLAASDGACQEEALLYVSKGESYLERKPPLTFLVRGESTWVQVEEENFIRTQVLGGSAKSMLSTLMDNPSNKKRHPPAEFIPDEMCMRSMAADLIQGSHCQTKPTSVLYSPFSGYNHTAVFKVLLALAEGWPTHSQGNL